MTQRLWNFLEYAFSKQQTAFQEVPCLYLNHKSCRLIIASHLRNRPLKLSWEASFRDSPRFYTLPLIKSRLNFRAIGPRLQNTCVCN